MKACRWLPLLALSLLAGCMGNTRPIGGSDWPYPVPPAAPDAPPASSEPLPPEVLPQLPEPPRPPPPRPTRPPASPADAQPPLLNTFPRSIEASGVAAPVLGLVKQSREAKRAKKYDQAAGSLERALRIDPRNAWVWQQLATLHLLMGQHEQALSEGRKSNSLAKRNPWIEVENYRVIAAAAAALGNSAAATQARIRYEDRQRWITTPPYAAPNP